jgi:hypothetical protein
MTREAAKTRKNDLKKHTKKPEQAGKVGKTTPKSIKK